MSDKHPNHHRHHRGSDTSPSAVSSSTLYSLNAGRDAFKNTPITDISKNDTEDLRRQQFAIRSFTQSVDEMDLPPAPELPPELDIDHYGFPPETPDSSGGITPSSTTGTIVEVINGLNGETLDESSVNENGFDDKLGETQKYPMTVPAPGHTEQEMEMHKSLVKHEDGDDSDSEIKAIVATTEKLPPSSRRPTHDKDHDALRREYSNAAKQRPRPTTPTQKCTLESYVSEQEKAASAPQGEKMKVVIPRKSLKGRQPEDFYQAMSSQMPIQMRHRSNSSSSNYDDDEEDIIEANPEYKDKAPKAPVVHRRTSIEWEAFDQSVERSIPMSEPPPPESSSEPKDEKIEEFKEAVNEVIEDSVKKQTAEAFAEELFGKNDDDWAKGKPSGSIPTQPSVDDPIFGVDQSEEPDVEEIPEVSLSKRGSRVEHREPPHQEEQAINEASAQPEASEDSITATHGDQQYYDYSAYGYDQNYGHYDPNQAATTDPNAATYDPASYNYDQSAYNYDQTGAYDYSQYGYDQTGAYSQDYSGYDANTYSGYGSTDPTAPGTATTDYGYDQGTEAQGADYSGTTGSYNPFATGGTDTAGAYDYGATADAATEGDQAAATHEGYGYDQSSYYDTSQYGAGYQYNDTTDYSQYGYQAPTEHQEPVHTAPEVPPSFTHHHPILPPMKQAEDPFGWDSHEPAGPSAQAPVEDTSQAVKKAPPPRPMPPPAEATQKPSRPPPPSPQPARPPPSVAKPAPPPPALAVKHESEEEEDPWARFNKINEKISSVVKNTEEKIKDLSENSAAKDIKDESYLANIGGSQGMMTPAVMRQMQQLEEEKKKAKADKKKAKHMKRPQSPEVTPKQEMDMDRAAAELAAKIAATRAHDLGDWKPPGGDSSPGTPAQVQAPPVPPPPISVDQKSEEKEESPVAESPDKEKAEPEAVEEPKIPSNWAAFGDTGDFSNSALPTSESDFFTQHLKEVPPAATDDPFAPPKSIDPFAPINGGDDFDPFDIRPAEDIVAQAKERAIQIAAREDQDQDIDYLQRPSSAGSSPTPEGGSPVSARPPGFEDEFKPANDDLATPLYDEDDSEPLTEFPKKFTGDGWDLMIRYPPKKKIMADRYWKPCYVRIKGNMLYIFNAKTDDRPMQEIMLQPTYSLSDATLQAYDIYGKIHTVKLQYVQYKERIGIRSGQIARLVEGHITKYGMPIEHAAQVTVLAKFGCLNSEELGTFINCIEDFLFTSKISREVVPQYKQDEVQIHCYDEYQAYVDKEGFVSQQQARVRMFCLAFVSGSPFLEIGLNDRRRQGKEIVRRKDILPMYTERWIRFENLDFHCTVDKKLFEEEQLLKITPPDGVFFEICRFRVRPPKNREKPLIVKSIMKIAGSKIEIRIDTMVAAHTQRAKGTNESLRTIPCEDIVIKFPIPEAWIYIFREERHWGVGSVHSKTRRPGKVKNLKDRIMGAVQQTENTLIEVAIGEAKYEHVFRSLVWRIPRLPEKHHGAYKQHLLKCRFDLSSFDLMPETFLPTCEVEFTMPLATISNTVVRSVSVEQHEDSDRVEKFVRYVAKCKYQLEVDYVQCNDLDNDAIFDTRVVDPEVVMAKQPDAHKPLFNPDEVEKQHGGYGIEFNEFETGNQRRRNDSSSDDEPEKRQVPIIEINMKGYGY